MYAFFIGIGVATGAIIAAEIGLDYSLGDKVKDLAIHIFQGAEAKAAAQVNRLKARLARIRSAL
jgi:hypothetical protein